MGRFGKVGNKLINSDVFAFTLLRSIASSQVSSWVDMISAFVLFSFCGLTPFLSTMIGAFVGGVLNCYINYRFTFHAYGCSWRAVIVKFAMVWIGSMLLNSFGTQIVYYAIDGWQWLIDIGFKRDGFFAAARLLVAFLVSAFWNFLLQRYFVYRTTSFDKYAIILFNWLTPGLRH